MFCTTASGQDPNDVTAIVFDNEYVASGVGSSSITLTCSSSAQWMIPNLPSAYNTLGYIECTTSVA
jgi:hypothetical protein